MQSKAKSVAQYLAELPLERRAALTAVRKVILANLDDDYEEGMDGMISYHVPHRVYPPGYHCNPDQPLPFAGLASQKGYMSLYLMSVYADGAEEGWLRKRFAAAGKKLDMGKCCVRFKQLSDLPLEVIGEAIRRVPAAAYVAHYERSILSKNKSAAASHAKNETKSAVRAGTRKTGKRVARKA